MAIEDDVASRLERIAGRLIAERSDGDRRSDARLLRAIAGEYKMLKRDSDLLRELTKRLLDTALHGGE